MLAGLAVQFPGRRRPGLIEARLPIGSGERLWDDFRGGDAPASLKPLVFEVMPSTRQRDFRGGDAPASLKPASTCSRGPMRSDFRGGDAPASLKPASTCSRGPMRSDFRGGDAPASLKLLYPGRLTVLLGLFPGRRRPGLIEACPMVNRWTISLHDFRGGDAPASLKHRQRRARERIEHQFPGRRRPGLIEAGQ